MSWKDCGSFAECIGEPEVDYDGENLDENDNPLVLSEQSKSEVLFITEPRFLLKIVILYVTNKLKALEKEEAQMRKITETHTGKIVSDTDLGIEYLYVGDYGKENNINMA